MTLLFQGLVWLPFWTWQMSFSYLINKYKRYSRSSFSFWFVPLTFSSCLLRVAFSTKRWDEDLIFNLKVAIWIASSSAFSIDTESGKFFSNMDSTTFLASSSANSRENSVSLRSWSIADICWPIPKTQLPSCTNDKSQKFKHLESFVHVLDILLQWFWNQNQFYGKDSVNLSFKIDYDTCLKILLWLNLESESILGRYFCE